MTRWCVWATVVTNGHCRGYVLVVAEAVLDALSHIAAMRAVDELEVPQHANKHPEGLEVTWNLPTLNMQSGLCHP